MAQPITVLELQAIPLFKGLEPQLLTQLATGSQFTDYAPTAVVFQEGDELPQCLYLLISGRLRIARIAASGKETILRTLIAGEVFAAPAIFGNGKAPATATALEAATVLTVKRQVLLQGFAQTPELALHLLGVFNQRLQQLHDQVHGLASERAIIRLIDYLDYLANYVGIDRVETGWQLRSRFDYYQIARSIGITYEECVRLFKQLQPVVTYRRGGLITMSDSQQLRALRTSL